MSAGLFTSAPTPFIWISAIWLACFVLLLITSKNKTTKSVWFNLAFVASLLGGLEIHSYSYLGAKDSSTFEGDYSQGFTQPHDLLGYAPTRNTTANSIKKVDGRLVYDVSYAIDDNGLRVSPVSKSPDPSCAVFFGGSFTFGLGVEDAETLPYIVGKQSSWQIYNFGVHGYGPHQMLSAIEHGLVEAAVACKPRLAVYHAQISHADRSAGFSSWDAKGPRYVLSGDAVEFSGSFDDSRRNAIRRRLEASYLFKRHFGVSRHKTSAQDVQLLLGIVSTSRSRLINAYPGLEFHVILWDDRWVREGRRHRRAAFESIRDGLVERGIELHLISEILPQFLENEDQYRLSAGRDNHPNPLAHQLIAEYVVDHILPDEHQ